MDGRLSDEFTCRFEIYKRNSHLIDISVKLLLRIRTMRMRADFIVYFAGSMQLSERVGREEKIT